MSLVVNMSEDKTHLKGVTRQKILGVGGNRIQTTAFDITRDKLFRVA